VVDLTRATTRDKEKKRLVGEWKWKWKWQIETEIEIEIQKDYKRNTNERTETYIKKKK
jgi:hypothetical protein